MNCYGCVKPCPDAFDNYGCENKVLKELNVKTLNREKSEELFNEIRRIEYLVSKLGGCVQNPDFVNEENAKENLRYFLNDYDRVIDKLVNFKINILYLHDEIIN